MKRRLFNLAAVVSFFTFIAIAWLCLISWSQSYGWPMVLTGPGLQVHARTGRIFIYKLSGPRASEPTVFQFSTPFVPGQPGRIAYTWFPGAAQDSNDLRYPPHTRFIGASGPNMPRSAITNGLGFGYHSERFNWQGLTAYSLTVISVPMWFPALVTLILPTRWVLLAHRHNRERRRTAAGLCPACGYDRRAPRPN